MKNILTLVALLGAASLVHAASDNAAGSYTPAAAHKKDAAEAHKAKKYSEKHEAKKHDAAPKHEAKKADEKKASTLEALPGATPAK